MQGFRINSIEELMDVLSGSKSTDTTEGRRGLAIDCSDEHRKLVGAELYDGLVAKAKVEKLTSEMQNLIKTEMEHCEEHGRKEERLENELRGVRHEKELGSMKRNRLAGLLDEIAASLESDRVLTAQEIRTGKRNALNLDYHSLHGYLPQTPKPAADPAQAAAEVPASGEAVGEGWQKP